MRRRRKNPDTLTTILLLASVAGSALVGFLLLRKGGAPTGTILVTTTGQPFTVSTDPLQLGAFKDAAGLLVDDCISAKNGVAGFTLPGVPAGQNTPMKVTQAGVAGAATVQAISVDPRVPPATVVTVPTAAIVAAGDCSGTAFP